MRDPEGQQLGANGGAPLVGRPRGAGWRALQADGVQWEGQVLLVGADVDLAARIIVTQRRLAFARGGNVVLDVARAWLHPLPILRPDGAIVLSVGSEHDPEPQQIELRLRDGHPATHHLLDLLGGPGYAARARPLESRPNGPRPARILPPLPDPDRSHQSERGVAMIPTATSRPTAPLPVSRRDPFGSSLDDLEPLEFPPLEPIIRPGPPPASIGRDRDWNLPPLPGMVPRAARRRRGWSLRLGGLVLLLALAAAVGSGRTSSLLGVQPGDDPTAPAVSGGPTVAAQVAPPPPTIGAGGPAPTAVPAGIGGPADTATTVPVTPATTTPEGPSPSPTPLPDAAPPTTTAPAPSAEGSDPAPTPPPAAPTAVPTSPPSEEPPSEPTVPPTATSPATEESEPAEPTALATTPVETDTPIAATEAPPALVPLGPPAPPTTSSDAEAASAPTETPPQPQPQPQPAAVDPLVFEVESVERGAPLPAFRLPPLTDGEWIAGVLGVRNDGDAAAGLALADLRLRVEPSGETFPLDDGTGVLADILRLDVAAGDDAVALEPGQARRLAFVFRLPAGAGTATLLAGETAIDFGPELGGVGGAEPTADSRTTGDVAADSELVEVLVVRVLDGERIEVDLGGERARVRYLGVNAPIGGSCYAAEATRINAALVESETVWLERQTSEDDPLGTLLRDVWVADPGGERALVALLLAEQGAVRPDPKEPDLRHADPIAAAAAAAREAEEGLWGAACADRAAAPEPLLRAIRPPVVPAAAVGMQEAPEAAARG